MELLELLYLDEEWLMEDLALATTHKRPNKPVNDLFRKREQEGAYKMLICGHLKSNEDKFVEYFRLTPYLFDHVLNFIKEQIKPNRNNKHSILISPEQQLCLTLRYLATGESYRSLSYQFRISNSHVSKIIKKVTGTIVKEMLNMFIPVPTSNKMRENAKEFHQKWNFPNCVGSIDGKHVRIKAPKKSGSLFYNYKEYYSIVLLAIVDAEYKFMAIDVGSYGREGDAGVFLKSSFGRQILAEQFNIPGPTALPNTDIVLPHVFLGDEAFSLHYNLLKPYPRAQSSRDVTKSIFNYRLSRARRTVENAFGIMAAYFRVFHQPIAVQADTCDKVIISCCILHNILRQNKLNAPNQTDFYDAVAQPTNNLVSMQPMRQGRRPQEHIDNRNQFKSYFNSVGAVSWQ